MSFNLKDIIFLLLFLINQPPHKPKENLLEKLSRTR